MAFFPTPSNKLLSFTRSAFLNTRANITCVRCPRAENRVYWCYKEKKGVFCYRHHRTCDILRYPLRSVLRRTDILAEVVVFLWREVINQQLCDARNLHSKASCLFLFPSLLSLSSPHSESGSLHPVRFRLIMQLVMRNTASVFGGCRKSCNCLAR